MTPMLHMPYAIVCRAAVARQHHDLNPALVIARGQGPSLKVELKDEISF
jgi:hypothetical protein